ncbi:MAG: lyase domain protein repeat-containing protein [Chthonomonadaceae bacterium]|nr:lyase domain protein repeat-containing protein [Chthonomonadaceae bacterium]
MDNPQIAHHIARLKNENRDVRLSAARALEEIDDPAVVPALVEALEDTDSSVRWCTAKALGEIGDPTAVPALIKALKDEGHYVRPAAAHALESIGNSVTLPRKILASSQLSAQTKIDVLETVRRIQYQEKDLTLQYIFPDTRTLCKTVLNEEDAQARQGARTLLNWLDEERVKAWNKWMISILSRIKR